MKMELVMPVTTVRVLPILTRLIQMKMVLQMPVSRPTTTARVLSDWT